MQCRHGNGAVGSMVDLIVDISPHSIADQAACTTSRHYVPWNERPCKRELAVDYKDAVPLSRQASRRRPFWLLGPGAGETVDCVVCGGAVGGGRYAVRIEQGNIKRRPVRPPRQHLTPVRRIWAKRPPRSDSSGGRDEVLFDGDLSLPLKTAKTFPQNLTTDTAISPRLKLPMEVHHGNVSSWTGHRVHGRNLAETPKIRSRKDDEGR
jgi:hypothetical protein